MTEHCLYRDRIISWGKFALGNYLDVLYMYTYREVRRLRDWSAKFESWFIFDQGEIPPRNNAQDHIFLSMFAFSESYFHLSRRHLSY